MVAIGYIVPDAKEEGEIVIKCHVMSLEILSLIPQQKNSCCSDISNAISNGEIPFVKLQ
jgi:hypothetical protein